MKVILALFDLDQQQGCSGSNYLCRSSEALRKSVLPPLDYTRNGVDRFVRLVFTSAGPEYWNIDAVESGHRVRRVRNLYYTRGFAEMLYREMILHSSKVKAMLPRLHVHGLQIGNPLVYLYPTHCKDWWPIVEDVFTSPGIAARRVLLEDEMLQHTEFQSISIDATLRICLRLQGQASYRAPATIRAQAPFDDEHSFRKLFTVRGRTGDVLLMEAIRDERADCIVECLLRNMRLEVQHSIKSIFCYVFVYA